ncbi:MAG: diguanylate cyclase [Myxococcales bacterium]|nr:diguanylate cyclase [Myxococcales bacterium]
MKARPTRSTPGPERVPEALIPGAIPNMVSPATTTDSALPCMEERTLERLTEVVERTQSVSAAPTIPTIPRAPYLVVLTGDHEGRVIKLPLEGSFVIGRSESCDLSLEDDGISRLHAKLDVKAGSVMLEDMDSRNGTFIGPQAVRRQRLLGDEIIRVGARTVLKFSLMDAVEEDYLRRLLAAALKDPLTGLYNRRHFDERLAMACAAAQRHGEPFALVLADVDDFKRVNDTYGHGTGDLVLRQVADILHTRARREDEVFRYGGEEFALVMRNTPLAGAAEGAERMRAAVALASVETDGVSVGVTLSLGVAAFRPGDTPEGLFDRSDRALYEAKHEGKNRAVTLSD